ncbi:MAG: NAD(P)H-dependent oxidoreductase [Defluviicoccus sp.]|nr:NAD(P)H-dependent oxidoreductase [Defluviicoccus sp.]MDE0384740.1 NAD(P)H-dependent oxidoreductase [Defluviicoccus sp.]
MTKVLYIEVSPRKERSHSIAVAEAFLEAYSAANPDHEIDKMDLWDTELPELNIAMIDAKYRLLDLGELDQREADAWRVVVQTFNRFNSADKIVLSTPMWNFNVPYKLKHLIDIIVQPDLAFAVVEGGYEGLVKGKPAMVIVARGAAYMPPSDFFEVDFQKRYLDFLFSFIGFEDVRSLVVEPMLTSPEEQAATRAKMIEEAREAAAAF